MLGRWWEIVELHGVRWNHLSRVLYACSFGAIVPVNTLTDTCDYIGKGQIFLSPEGNRSSISGQEQKLVERCRCQIGGTQQNGKKLDLALFCTFYGLCHLFVTAFISQVVRINQEDE